MNLAQVQHAILSGLSAGISAGIIVSAAAFGCLRWLIRVERKSWTEES